MSNVRLTHYQRSLKIKEDLGDIAGIASSLHQIGNLHHARGNYDEALSHYQRSLKIQEDLEDIAGVALTQGQTGSLMMELGRHEQAFALLVAAMITLTRIESPYAGVAANLLRDLRLKCGEGQFDAQWRRQFDDDPPEWIKTD